MYLSALVLSMDMLSNRLKSACTAQAGWAPVSCDKSELLRTSNALDQPFQTKCAGPTTHTNRPDERDWQPRAGVFGRRAGSVLAETPGDIPGSSGVQRPVAATQNVDEGQGRSLPRAWTIERRTPARRYDRSPRIGARSKSRCCRTTSGRQCAPWPKREEQRLRRSSLSSWALGRRLSFSA